MLEMMMKSARLRQLTLIMFLALHGFCRGQDQTFLIPMGTNSVGMSESNPPRTYPNTPYVTTRTSTTNPTVQSVIPTTEFTTSIPPEHSSSTSSSSAPPPPFDPSRPTPHRSPASTLPLFTTTLPQVFTTRTTGLPNSGVSGPSGTPQRVQIGFDNRYEDLGVSDFDMWANRQSAQNQLSQVCMITSDRITDVSIQPNSTGFLVLRFTIQQGYPIYTSEAVQLLKNKLRSTNFMQLSGQLLDPSSVFFWTDDGPCPGDRCMNGGLCNVNVSGTYECQCNPGYIGAKCEEPVTPATPSSTRAANTALLALLALLVVPIAVALVAGFVVGRRRQQKLQLRRAFDLRDVRTIGPKSMLSLPTQHDQGVRNNMYETRSFAIAFTDTSFTKSGSSSPPNTTDDDMSHMGKE